MPQGNPEGYTKGNTTEQKIDKMLDWMLNLSSHMGVPVDMGENVIANKDTPNLPPQAANAVTPNAALKSFETPTQQSVAAPTNQVSAVADLPQIQTFSQGPEPDPRAHAAAEVGISDQIYDLQTAATKKGIELDQVNNILTQVVESGQVPSEQLEQLSPDELVEFAAQMMMQDGNFQPLQLPTAVRAR